MALDIFRAIRRRLEELRLVFRATPEELRLLRMKNAYRSSEAFSALLATMLIPFVLVVSGAFYYAIQFLLEEGLARGIVALLMACAVMCIGVLVWMLMDEFFYSANRTVPIVCFVLSFCFLREFGKFATGLVYVAPTGDMTFTLYTAFCSSVSFYLYWHGLRVALLKKGDRVCVARSHVGEPILLRYAKVWSPIVGRRRMRSINVFAVPVLMTMAKITQGCSAFFQLFSYGAALFLVSITMGAVASAMRGTQALAGLRLSVEVQGMIIIFHVILIIIIFLFVRITILFKRSARWLSRLTFEQSVEGDRRAPVLFLRSFADDQVTLPPLPIHVRWWLAEPTPIRLDNALIERFNHVGPVVALGTRNGTSKEQLPFGAARLYIDDAHWEQCVLELAAHAAAIVLVADESPGVIWETREMAQPPFENRVLFLASPRNSGHGLEGHPILGPILTSVRRPAPGFMILAAFRRDGDWELLTAIRPEADDYLMCCKAFFSTLPPARIGPLALQSLPCRGTSGGLEPDGRSQVIEHRGGDSLSA